METRIGLTLAIAMICADSSARADDYLWNAPAGGSFQEPTNWLGPVAPPGPADRAIFDLDATYQVDFDASAENNTAIAKAGNVVFDLQGREYEVNQLCVGRKTGCDLDDSPGTAPVVSIVNGTIEAIDLRVNDSSLLRVLAGGKLIGPSLVVGEDEGANLEVLESGLVVNSDVTLGFFQSATGEALIDGGGSTWIAEDMVVGDDGRGELRIQNGGFLSTRSAMIADYSQTASAGGLAEIIGSDSAWINAFDLVVGGALTGRLRVQDGGLAATRNAFLGLQSELLPFGLEGRGYIEVDGVGSLLRVSEAIVLGGYLDVDLQGVPGGFGHLLVSNGGQVVVGEQLLLRNRADVDLQGGGVDVGSLAATALPGELRVHELGFVGGAGSIVGSVGLSGELDPGGTNGAPGNLESIMFLVGPRLLQIEGGFTAEDGARLTFDIAGAAASGAGEGYDAAEVVGTVQLGGELVVNVSPSIASALGPGDVFTVLTAAAIAGGFANVPSGSSLQEAGGLGSFQVFYGPGSPFGAGVVALTGFEFVPEPAQVLLVLTGGLVLEAVRRKQRA